MPKADVVYSDLLKDIMENGVIKNGRNGDTISTFGRMIRFNMEDGFPLLTTKKMFTKGIITELLWFLSGSTNIRPLVLDGNNIWVGDAYKNYLKNWKPSKTGENDNSMDFMDVELVNERPLPEDMFIECIKKDESFAKTWGELGPVYGKQWTNWGVNGVNQIDNAINSLRENPSSRRIMVNAWNVEDIEDMVLPPCHFGFQLNTTELTHMERCRLSGGNCETEYNNNIIQQKKHLDNYGIPTHKLSLMWNQRSVDVPLGLPFNIASYGLLLTIFSRLTNMVPYELIGSLGDTHIYENQIGGVKEQLLREPRELPKLDISPNVNFSGGLDKFLKTCTYKDFTFLDYDPHPVIKLPLSN